MPSKGNARWLGDLQSGSGTFTAGDSLSGKYSFKSRFEDGSGANPEQLIAAAHAACFSMALASLLAKSSHTPTSIETDATVTLRLIDGVQTIARIDLVTTGVVANVSIEEFESFAIQAKNNCIVSRALGAVNEITLESHLGVG